MSHSIILLLFYLVKLCYFACLKYPIGLKKNQMAKTVWISGGGKVWGTWEDLFYQNDEKHFQLEKRKHVISPQIYTYMIIFIYFVHI